MNFNYTNELDNFIKYLSNGGYKKATINGYYFGIKDFFDYLGENNINNLNFTNNDIKNYREHIKNKNSKQTINAKIYAIKKYIEYLDKEKGITIKHNIEIIKIRHKKNIIPIKKIETILNYIEQINKHKIISERDKLLIKMLYYTGCKTKELLTIKRNNINESILKLEGKTIILDKNLLNDINNYTKKFNIQNNQYLFFSFAKQKLNFNSHIVEKSVEDLFNKYKTIINNKLSIIDLRNSYAINLKDELINIKIGELHSHETIKFNKDYLKLSAPRYSPKTS